MSARLNRSGASTSGGSELMDTTGNTTAGFDALVLPEITPDLIAYLNRMFPDRLSLVKQLGSVEAAKGARTVIEHLHELLKEQDNDNVLRRRQFQPPTGPDSAGPSAPAAGG